MGEVWSGHRQKDRQTRWTLDGSWYRGSGVTWARRDTLLGSESSPQKGFQHPAEKPGAGMGGVDMKSRALCLIIAWVALLNVSPVMAEEPFWPLAMKNKAGWLYAKEGDSCPIDSFVAIASEAKPGETLAAKLEIWKAPADPKKATDIKLTSLIFQGTEVDGTVHMLLVKANPPEHGVAFWKEMWANRNTLKFPEWLVQQLLREDARGLPNGSWFRAPEYPVITELYAHPSASWDLDRTAFFSVELIHLSNTLKVTVDPVVAD